MKNRLIEYIKTVDDMELLREEISLLLTVLLKKDYSGFYKQLESKVRFTVAEIIKSEVEQNKIDPESYLRGTEEELNSIGVVTLFLGFEPSNLSIVKFYDYIQSAIRSKIALGIHYQPELIGGAIVEYQGQYHDLSLKNMVQKSIGELEQKYFAFAENVPSAKN